MSRLDRLREELVENGVIDETNNAMAAAISEELEYALYPPIHEGKTPTYGCILVENDPSTSPSLIATSGVTSHISRQLANGSTSFAIRYGEHIPFIECFSQPHEEETSLITLRSAWNGIVVHRSSDEVVRVLTHRGIFSSFKGTWSLRPYSRKVVDIIIQSVPQADERILRRLLDFSFHFLSARRTGATIVWWLVEIPSDAPQSPIDLSMINLDVTKRKYYGAFQGLLRQHDGAAFLYPDGTLASIGAHLSCTEQAKGLVQATGGTRHTSAKRYSFDQPSVIVVVVSEDGPVSIFSDGAKLAELHSTPIGSAERSLARLVPEKAADIVTSFEEIQCPNCGKHVLAEIVLIYGWRDLETGDCPVCGKTIVRRQCFRIITRLRKRL